MIFFSFNLEAFRLSLELIYSMKLFIINRNYFFSYVSYCSDWYYWECIHHHNHPKEQSPSSPTNQLIFVKYGPVRFYKLMHKYSLTSFQKRCSFH